MPTLRQHIKRLRKIAEVGSGSRAHGAEVRSIPGQFKGKNWHPRYESDSAISRAIRDVSRAFRELGKVDGATRYTAERREINALNAVSRLELLISADGDSLTCLGWAACEGRFRGESERKA